MQPLLKLIFIAICITQATISCAADQGNPNRNEQVENSPMTLPNTDCKTNSISKSKAFINFMLNDITTNYAHTGGGGITSIKETMTNTFKVSIAQEERIDVFTYELAIDDRCTVTLINKTESTVSFGQ